MRRCHRFVYKLHFSERVTVYGKYFPGLCDALENARAQMNSTSSHTHVLFLCTYVYICEKMLI